ncbi:enolase [Alicyclobacillus contaminans]|uniref:phosphopyruvate hydratase n=1 Tax=Alicyclobacillus contaminans TaxID=392016 RepID=UPI0003FC0017|nr:phosphopyruvate hydratase [Alicyclobacillus contaminans]GMA50853.1 enolase [Alicyclobacillus contaminans]
MAKILALKAREILDSRGLPTLEVELQLTDGACGRASVPSGKSTGSKEAVEWRDGDKTRFRGRGVLGAVQHVQGTIARAVQGCDFDSQEAFDRYLTNLDGTMDKHRLGANAILGCSMAFARAAAVSKKCSLVQSIASIYETEKLVFPVPMMNVINGGKHADSGVSTQEFMLIPHGADTISDAIRMGAETYQALRLLLESKGFRVAIGDEGGFAPQLKTTEGALELLVAAIEQAGYIPGAQISLGLDFAANDFYQDGHYLFEGHTWTSDEMTAYCLQLAQQFPIVSIEDGLSEYDWQGWETHTKALNENGIQCVGDDIFVTHANIFQRGIDQGIANAILIKLNQVGTVTETLETMRLARAHQYKTVVSHRSGETDDAFIADFALATAAGQMKAGAPARGERVAKYNQLLRLQETFPDAPLAAGVYQKASKKQ